jgi:hypothetical protein
MQRLSSSTGWQMMFRQAKAWTVASGAPFCNLLFSKDHERLVVAWAILPVLELVTGTTCLFHKRTHPN